MAEKRAVSLSNAVDCEHGVELSFLDNERAYDKTTNCYGNSMGRNWFWHVITLSAW